MGALYGAEARVVGTFGPGDASDGEPRSAQRAAGIRQKLQGGFAAGPRFRRQMAEGSIQESRIRADARICARGASARNPSHLATVLAEATYLPGRGFDWKSLFEDLLHDGGEVLVDRKVDKAWIAGSGSLQALSRAANNMLLHHQPALAVIDEGGGLVEAGTIDALKHNIGYLKSLGNRSRTHIAIFGDYSLARLTEFSGQLNRRCHTVHFPPYGVEQLSVFDQIVASFERRYVTKGVPASLCGSTPLLFERSCGCVGLLHRWVEVAEIEAAAAKRPFDAEMLMRTAPPQGAVDCWKTEIAQGQAAMARYFGGEKL